MDRYLIRKEIIDKRKQNEYLEKVNLAMLPHMDEKAQKRFFRELEQETRKPLPVGKGTKTDHEALKRAKEQQNRGI
ncbi:hypothetical protein NSA56_01800 [Oceanobacillus caeni]|uniref:hypothetical protein n=1 Tax=Oceanobacillus caeni TaxID=405946 RepID=UPI00214A16D2|nr:hypothetical protein [Oceanobacillus caeni]MCR1833130.1 hypothetical protein [Oceanobacillus caeni]